MKRRRALGPLLIVAATATLTFLSTLDWLFPPALERPRQLSVVVEDSEGRMLRPFLSADGKWRLATPIEAVDPRFLDMLKGYEDRRFDFHPGIDPLAVIRAGLQFVDAGHVVSGASTLTMQVARLLEPERRGRGLGAKLYQSLRALQLEWRLSKREILGLYLTLAPYGGNIEGVRAASLAYFGKEPKRLTLAEAALLVALPQSPERQRPDRDPVAAKSGRDKVLSRLAAEDILAPTLAREAQDDLLRPGRRALPFAAPHLAEALARRADPGARITTTLDATLQSTLEALARQEAGFQSDGANLAFLVVENRSQAVKAYVGNADYWGPAGQLDLARALRSPGSTLKPFIYGMAFDDLVAHPATLIEDRPTLFGDYQPRNFDRGYQGTVTIADALRLSLNVPAVALLDRVGPQRFAARLNDAHVTLAFSGALGGPSLPLALGGVGTTLMDLTTLYRALADGGTVRALRTTAAAPLASPARLFGAEAAWYVRDILIDSPLPDGWGDARGLVRRPVAYKTGTSYGFRDAWAIGVSERFTVGVWVGRPDGSTRPGVYGRNTAAPLLLRVFDLLPAESAARPPPPPGALVVAANEALPRGLRHFAVNRAAGSGQRAPAQPLEIAFPPDGATVALGGQSEAEPLALRAAGGQGRLYWLVDGLPLDASAIEGRRALWQPSGPGFARLTVVDAEGQQANASVRLVAPR